jgi:hypothetical protein
MRGLRTIFALGAVLTAIAGAVTTAQARPVDHSKFADEFGFVTEECGLQVQVDGHESGHVNGRVVGNGTLRYTVTHHGEATWTNVATGRAFRFVWNYLDQDLRVTDNGDGTLTIYGHSPGAERTYGPDGQLLDNKPGLFTWLITIEDGGTPTDPSDDIFLGITFLSGPAVYGNLCEDFRALTA